MKSYFACLAAVICGFVLFGPSVAQADSEIPTPDKAQLAWTVPLNTDWKDFGPLIKNLKIFG